MGLEETAKKRKLKFTEEHIWALDRFDPEFRDRHIEVQLSSFVGTLKDVRKVYPQPVLDYYNRHALRAST